MIEKKTHLNKTVLKSKMSQNIESFKRWKKIFVGQKWTEMCGLIIQLYFVQKSEKQTKP